MVRVPGGQRGSPGRWCCKVYLPAMLCLNISYFSKCWITIGSRMLSVGLFLCARTFNWISFTDARLNVCLVFWTLWFWIQVILRVEWEWFCQPSRAKTRLNRAQTLLLTSTDIIFSPGLPRWPLSWPLQSFPQAVRVVLLKCPWDHVTPQFRVLQLVPFHWECNSEM